MPDRPSHERGSPANWWYPPLGLLSALTGVSLLKGGYDLDLVAVCFIVTIACLWRSINRSDHQTTD